MADWDNSLVVVCGPTATGKTQLALALCEAFGGELVGADSMQVYEGLPIGTAALRPEEAPGVARHLTGCMAPDSSFSVAGYTAAAREVIGQIHSRGRLPVVCGGTGMYIENLVNGTTFTDAVPPDELLRELELAWENQGGEAMLQRLARLDEEHAGALAPRDKKRILRSLAMVETTGLTYRQRAQQSRAEAPPYRALLLGLDCADRQALYGRINARVDAMLAEGLLSEARRVFENRGAYGGVVQAIGYKEFFPFFEEEAPQEACVEQLKMATRRYAKRQLTWFRRMPEVHWLEVEDREMSCKAKKLVGDFLEETTLGRV